MIRDTWVEIIESSFNEQIKTYFSEVSRQRLRTIVKRGWDENVCDDLNSRPCENSLANFCTSAAPESSKKEPIL